MKIIELLNKIANGEKVPKEIIYDGWRWYLNLDKYYNHIINDELTNYIFKNKGYKEYLNTEIKDGNMELEIGMYVRTINGKIWIIISQKAISGHRKDIKKASYNIIDLIEVGDYVNGCYVDEVFEYEDDTKGITICDASHSVIFNDKKIKSIVTKEQFESMEYKVGE